MAVSAPKTPNGIAINTDSGSDHFSYWAARIRNTIKTARPSANVDAPPERFSWYDVPLQSKLNSDGSVSFAIRSTLAMAWPVLTLGRPLPKIFTAGRLLERSSASGPDEYLTLTSEASCTISPFSERT